MIASKSDALAELGRVAQEAERLRKELELWQYVAVAARGFIQSHVADPDITDEMCLHHGAYMAAEKRLAEYYELKGDTE